MLKLLRYLRPYLVFVLMIIVLLYVQAMTDLELPAQMARIVNTGLQQSGIESAVPDVMRASRYDQLVQLSGGTLAEDLAAAYKIKPAGTDDAGLLARYPLLRDESLAFLRPIGPDQRDQLNHDLTPLFFIIQLVESSDSPFGSIPGFESETPDGGLYPGSDEQIIEAVRGRLEDVPEQVINQGALAAVAAEYEQIGIDLNRLQTDFLWRAGGRMLLIALISAVASILVGLLAARLAAGIGRDLRSDLFRKVTYFSSAEYDSFSPASLITRSTNDVQQIQMMLVMLLRILFYAPILGVGGVLKATRSNLSMGWIIALAVALLLGLIIILSKLAIPRFKKVQKLIDRVNLVTREMLSGLMVIRAFNRDRGQEAKFDRANLDLTRVNLFVSRLMAVMWPLMTLIMNGISLLIIRIGADQIDQGNMQVGDVMAFIQYTMQIIMSFLMVSMIFIMIPRASVSAQRIDEVLKVEPSIRDPEQPASFPADGPGEIELRQVSFRYPGADDDVLHRISLTARPGQTTAIIGSTGCGKSTLINLIPRFYDVTEGQILIDGIDIRQVRQTELRRRIGYVPQQSMLFSGDIASNLRFSAETAEEEELAAALETAQAADFVNSDEGGLARPIAQNGANVSGGQRQRLSIARALAGNPDIYIFDDSFSALDYRTDASLRRALKQKTGQATVLIVAQRIGTILHADQIIVLDDGRIVGRGRHRDLLRTCQVYHEIAASQLSEEELAR